MSVRRATRNGQGGAKPTINVSEIADYAYCSRAWWYRHVAQIPVPRNGKYGRLAAGTRAHRSHGNWVRTGMRLRFAGISMALLGLIALALAIWLTLQK